MYILYAIRKWQYLPNQEIWHANSSTYKGQLSKLDQHYQPMQFVNTYSSFQALPGLH